jgi:hypothetical protein
MGRNIISNKKLAREFLFFLTLLIVPVAALVYITLNNEFKLIEIRENRNTLLEEKLILDSLELILIPFDNKAQAQNHFDYDLKYKFGLSSKDYLYHETWDKLILMSQYDSVKHYWDKRWNKKFVLFLKSLGHNTPLEFQDFIDKNTITVDEWQSQQFFTSKQNEIQVMVDDLNEMKRALILPSVRNKLMLNWTLGAFIILFVLRYMWYGLTWSLKTIRAAD